MSPPPRNRHRAPCDFYPTPAWCVDRLLDRIGGRILPPEDRPRPHWLEPAVGYGSIVVAVAEWVARQRAYTLPLWTTCDVRPELAPDVPLDFLGFGRPALAAIRHRWDVVLSNPPYDQALPFVVEAGRWAPIVIMLLRLNWLASAERADWLRRYTPSIYVLPDRPSFTGDGGSDGAEYAWFAWGLGPPTVEILDKTPISKRRPTRRPEPSPPTMPTTDEQIDRWLRGEP